MATKKKVVTKGKTMLEGRRRMTGTDAVFGELEAMSREEQEEIVDRLLDWINENSLAP